MEMQEAYARADLVRLEQRIVELEAKIMLVRAGLEMQLEAHNEIIEIARELLADL